MENIVFTQLSIPEIRQIFRQELDSYFKILSNSLTPHEYTKDIISIEEASKLIGKAKPTIYGLVSARKIPFYKNGKQLYFSREELLKWIKAGYTPVSKPINEIVDDTLNSTKRKRK